MADRAAEARTGRRMREIREGGLLDADATKRVPPKMRTQYLPPGQLEREPIKESAEVQRGNGRKPKERGDYAGKEK